MICQACQNIFERLKDNKRNMTQRANNKQDKQAANTRKTKKWKTKEKNKAENATITDPKFTSGLIFIYIERIVHKKEV